MALAKLPDSKRDSNTKSSLATWPVLLTLLPLLLPLLFGCAFIRYFALPIHDRLNCFTSKQLSYDLLCAFILTFNCASGGGGDGDDIGCALHVICADDSCCVPMPVSFPLTLFTQIPFGMNEIGI